MEHLLDFLPKRRTQMRNSQLLSACGSLSRHVNAQVVMHRGTGCKRRTYRDHMSPLKLPSPWSFRKQSLEHRSKGKILWDVQAQGSSVRKKREWGRGEKKGIGGNAGLHWPELHSESPRAITGCGWLNNGPQRHPHPSPQTCENAV